MKKQIRSILDSLRDFIIEHRYEDKPILSVYVNIDTTNPDNRRDRPAWMIEVKNEAKQLAEVHGTDALKRRDVRRQWEDVENAVMSHLEKRKPEGKSVVMFTDLEDYLTVDLPIPLPTKLYYGVPQIKPLLFALDRFKKYLVILFSEEETKSVPVFLTAALDKTRAETGIEGGFSLRPGGRTARTQASERRDLDTERKVVNELAAEINANLLDDPDVQHVVFGGNLKIAHAVKNALHPAVADRLVTIEPIAYESTKEQIADAIRELAEQQEQEHDLALVNELVARRHACGTAVLERQGVLEALEHGLASKLIVSVPIASDEFDPLLIRSVLNNSPIEFVHAAAAEKLNEFGGIAATLYYSGR